MKTAIITGASAGLGSEFAVQLRTAFPEVGRVWLIARREDRLRQLAERLDGMETVIVPLDLCDRAAFDALAEKLAEEKPDVAVLINNAGCGYLQELGQGAWESQSRMTELNVTALTAVTHLVIPYMPRGSRIINVSSIAAFCPNARMTVYSSTKAYVSSFTRGLAVELKGRGVSVTAVCPGPMDTEFIEKGGIKGNSPMFAVLPFSDPAEVVAGALKAAKAGRVFYTHRIIFKIYRVLAKLLPHAIVAPLGKC